MRMPRPNEITQLLLRWSRGEQAALEQLMPVVYDGHYKLALGYLRRERPDHTLQPTALINEAYLRLIKQDFPGWQSRRHFYGMASQLMRQILVEYARGGQTRRRRAKIFARRSSDVFGREGGGTSRARRRSGRPGEVRRAQGPHH
jgi:RNA polymerase sigma factor (TIGR02999 family)